MRSKYTIRRWFSYQIILKTTISYHVPSMLYSIILTTYPYIVCPCFNPQSTFFNDAYLYMIFVCANCASFSSQPTILNSACINYFLYTWDVTTSQYSQLIFEYAGCPAWTKWLSGVPRQRIFMMYSSFIFCMILSRTTIKDKPWIYHYKTLVRY